VALRFPVQVQPSSRQPKVGGMRAGSLSVKVREAAVDGAANEAVVEVIALEFALRPRNVRIIHGRAGRRKLIEVEIDPDQGATILGALKSRT